MRSLLCKNPLAFVVRRGNIEGRLDASYYKPQYREVVERLRNSPFELRRLGEIVSLSAERWKSPKAGTFRYIEINDIDTFSAQIISANQLNVEDAPSRAQILIRENDILVSTTRPYRGATALVTKEFNNCVCSTGFAVIRDLKTQISRQYLLRVLHSNFSLRQMEQRMTGGNYPAITPDELLKIWIPLPPIEIQGKIAEIMDEAVKEKDAIEREADSLLNSVDDYLLQELGITLRRPEERGHLTYKVGSSFLKGQRWDVEHWKPEYADAEKAIQNGQYEVLSFGKLVEKMINGLDYRNFSEIGTKYIRVGNIKPFEIDETDIKHIPITFDDVSKDILLEKSNILITRKGTFGVAVSVSNGQGIISSEIFKVVLKKDIGVNAYYITAVLNSIIGRNQFSRKSVGAIMGSLSQEAVKSVLIPLPPREVQDKITRDVESTIQKAKQLKEKATMVLIDAAEKMERVILGEDEA